MNSHSYTDEETELLDAFSKAEPIEHTRESSASTVLSVRMARTLLRRLTEVARTADKPVGTVARELIEEGVDRRESETVANLLLDVNLVLAQTERSLAIAAAVRSGLDIERSSRQSTHRRQTQAA
jgi:predicted DNA-binding protein